MVLNDGWLGNRAVRHDCDDGLPGPLDPRFDLSHPVADSGDKGVKSPSATEHPVEGEILAAIGARVRDDPN